MAQGAGCSGGQGGVLWILLNLFTLRDWPTASVPDSLGGCVTHILFSLVIELEALDSEALGLQASPVVSLFQSNHFYPAEVTPSRTTIQTPCVGIVDLSFELIGHVS